MLCSVVSLANDGHCEGPMRHNYKNWLKNLLFSQNISMLPIRESDIKDYVESSPSAGKTSCKKTRKKILGIITSIFSRDLWDLFLHNIGFRKLIT